MYIKYMLFPFDYASRNKRELSVVRKFDFKIVVCDFNDREGIRKIDGYTVYSRKLDLSNSFIVRKLQVLYRWFVVEPKFLRSQHADCISCHDLVALFCGWLSTWFVPKKKKPLLIYDSHEFEIGRNTEGKRSLFKRWIIPKLEKFLINRSAFSIMVNDSIADEVQKIHKLKERPVVVRNTPNYWEVDENICRKRRMEICQRLKVTDDTFIVMYHGGIMSGRGIENLLRAIQRTKDTAAVILGCGEASYTESLKQHAEELGISKRVHFYEAVPIDILWQYVGAVDAGVTLALNICINHYYMLPNKLFENIQSLTPIIGSDFPEIRRIIEGYDIGLLVNPENINEIAKAITEMKNNKGMYNKFKKNLKKAKEDLCWENESKVLEDAYMRVLGKKL